jgi:hypothetical protein
MASVTYEARRDLVPYHVSGSDYSFDFEISDLGRPQGGALRNRTESLNGATETLYFGRRRIWSATTIPMQLSSALAGLMQEFLGSTDDGQEFSFDPYGDGNVLTVTREDEGASQPTFSVIDGPNDYVQFAFQVREVV